MVLCPLSFSLHSSVCGADSLQPVVSCVGVSAATLDGILELMSLCGKEFSEGLEEKEAALGREGKKRKLFEQPNSQCQRTEVGGVGGHDRGGRDGWT